MLSTLTGEPTQSRDQKKAQKTNQKRSRDEQIYNIFSHPLRSKIIELLGTKGPLGFTALRDETKIGVGTLYYHISVLGDLVAQGRDKRYMLSETGKAAHQVLVKGPKLTPNKPSGETWGISPFLSGILVLRIINQSSIYHIPWAFALLFLGAWASSEAGLRPSILFLLESTGSAQIPPVFAFMLGWLIVFAILAAISTLVFRRREGNLSLVVTFAISYLPIVAFAVIWLASKSIFLGLTQALDGWFMRILFFALQGWSLILLVSSLRTSKGLSTKESAITVLILVYLNAAFVIGGGEL